MSNDLLSFDQQQKIGISYWRCLEVAVSLLPSLVVSSWDVIAGNLYDPLRRDLDDLLWTEEIKSQPRQILKEDTNMTSKFVSIWVQSSF